MITLAQLEILTSPGLVRRAGKALEKESVQWITQGEPFWEFTFEQQQGRLHLSALEQSRCNCPAGSLCKHIVAAGLFYLQQQQNDAPFVAPVLLQPDLFQQAGKAATRQVYKQWASLDWAKVQLREQTSHIEIQWDDNKVILQQGDGLQALIAESDQLNNRLLAGLIYLQQQQPIVWPAWLQEEQRAAAQQQAEEQQQRDMWLRQQLFNLLQIGVRQLQVHNLAELLSQAPLFKASGDRALGNAIVALQTLVERRSQQQGLDPSEEIVELLTRIYRITESRATRVGLEQTQANLRLLCVGGHQWFNHSGAQGLNMLFLSSDGRIFSASLSRSQAGQGFSPSDAWHNQALWQGMPLNQLASNKYFQLSGAQFKEQGQLSLSQQTQAVSTAAFDWLVTEDWSTLKNCPLYGYALVHAASCRYCEFDEVTQQLLFQINQANGQSLLIHQAYHRETANRIVNLQRLKSARDFYLVVRHLIRNHQHQFEAVCVYQQQWSSLDFETPPTEQLDLLQRLISRMAASTQPATSSHPLLPLFNRTAEWLLDYPHLDWGQQQALLQHYQILGLNLLASRLQSRHMTAETCLQLQYLLSCARLELHGWPIITTAA